MSEAEFAPKQILMFENSIGQQPQRRWRRIEGADMKLEDQPRSTSVFDDTAKGRNVAF